MEPFKNIYNKNSIKKISDEIVKIDPNFKSSEFIKQSTKNINALEMKQRVVLISNSLWLCTSGTYKTKISLLLKTIKTKKNPQGLDSFLLWPFSYFVEKYGINDFKTSFKALKKITQVFTAEFGIRPFFEKNPDYIYIEFSKLIQNPCEHIRRWISEGTRPNLPWGMNVSHLKSSKYLKKNILLLNQLINDDSVYVLKSIANHMNDISWIDEKLALKTIKIWNKKIKPSNRWVLKQALRNLIKKGNQDALEILGYSSNINIETTKLKLSKINIKENEKFNISFNIKNLNKQPVNLMIDYKIFFIKANKTSSPKVFKLKSLLLEPNINEEVSKTIHIKKVTTRKHYSGVHKIVIQINGKNYANGSFKLKV